MTEIIIPIKPLSLAKQRLSALLTPPQREQLAALMLEDLLHTLSSVAGVHVSIVTSDSNVAALARQWGVRHIQEESPRGYNSAVRLGLSRFAPGYPVAVLPGDIPVVTGQEISALVKPVASTQPVVRLAPSRDGFGTNGLYKSGSNLLSPAYGHDSFRIHQQAARKAGLSVELLDLPGMALDIDTPEDLSVLYSLDMPSASLAFLRSLDLIRGIA